MIPLTLALLIALTVVFFVVERRAAARWERPAAARAANEPGRAPVRAEADAGEAVAPAGEEPEPPIRTPEDVERDIYRDLYAARSGDVTPRRPAH
ncbi:MAG: hypothetical protein JOZ25_02700 [Actinobacteria bacterium]|nr:hypothetical protein [Actinomycetota bacterium]